MPKKMIKMLFVLLITNLIVACTGLPNKVTPVDDFEVKRYLGKWYEIARLDHSFERGLVNVSADYSLRQDGGIKVINMGFSTEKQQWQEADGKAFFVGSDSKGHLKVSFFGPFYGSYVIFELDKENYQYAFVSGPNLSYLWLLSRTPTVEQDVIDLFISKSSELGFATEQLIFVEQNKLIK